MTSEEIITLVREEKAKGRVVYQTESGIYSAPLSEFCKQPSAGILYDLNRGFEVTAAILKEEKYYPRLINDLAVAIVIEYLRNEIETLKQSK